MSSNNLLFRTLCSHTSPAPTKWEMSEMRRKKECREEEKRKVFFFWENGEHWERKEKTKGISLRPRYSTMVLVAGWWRRAKSKIYFHLVFLFRYFFFLLILTLHHHHTFWSPFRYVYLLGFHTLLLFCASESSILLLGSVYAFRCLGEAYT